jgi:hypothetical protein
MIAILYAFGMLVAGMFKSRFITITCGFRCSVHTPQQDAGRGMISILVGKIPQKGYGFSFKRRSFANHLSATAG